MALSLANVVSPDLTLPHEVANLFSAGPTYAVLTAFAALFLILTVLWYRKVPAVSSQTAEWFLAAGRNMKSGIVAASIVCTWTWAATLMVSSAKGYQHGIAGPYWYAAGATIPLLLFAILAIYLKRRAPMAHTFGEFVLHRFGGPSHKLMLCLGLLSCTIVTAMVVLGGAYALRALTGLDVRLAVLLIPLAFAFYSALGGLRGSIVVEYAQMVILLGIALVLTIWFWSGQGDLGIFERLRALPAREGENYLTIASLAALLFGIVNTIGNFGTVFMDQTYWQRAIAASDHSAGRSFLIGGLAWFAIPFGVATAFGVGGLALGFAVPAPYTDIAPTVAAAVFGPLGGWLFLIMLFMAIISTGNAESVAVASLVATDIYKTYLRPHAGDADILRVARRTTLAFALLIGPVCLALHSLAIDMEWLYLTMGIFVGAGVIPLALGLLTDRLTGRGAYWATMGGLVVGFVAWLTAAHELEGAITLETLGRMRPITIGNLAVFLTSALICGIDCARPHARFRFELLQDAIRSYLAPPIGTGVAGTPARPPARLSGQERQVIQRVVGFSILLELIVPGGLYLSGIQFGRELFAVWVIVSLVWLLMAAGFIILLPIKDHFETEYPEHLGLTLHSSIGNRLFLSFLTVVLTVGVGAIVSLVKFGSVEYLREANEQVISEEALHEKVVYSLIPQVLEERSRGKLDGPASYELSEQVKHLAASPFTPEILRAMISSSEAHGPIHYLGLEEKERAFIADSVDGAYHRISMANAVQMGQERHQSIVLILASLVGTLFLGLLLTIRASAAITLPVRHLAEASRRFAAGDPPVPPLPVETADEIGVLTEEFNAMAARIREQVTALKAAEEEFRLIVNHVNDAIIYLDVEGGIRWGNEQVCVLLGRPMGKVIGLPIVSVLTPESVVLATERLAAVRLGGLVHSLVELSLTRSDGQIVSVEANVASVCKNGKVVGRLLVFRDITKRKRAEEALKKSEQYLRSIIGMTPECVKLVDRDGTLLAMNPAGLEMIEAGCAADAIGQNVYALIAPEFREAFQKFNERVCRGENGFMEYEIIGMRGMHRWVETHAAPIPSHEDGRLVHLAVTRDITERKRVEEEIRRTNALLTSILENLPDMIFVKDAKDHRFVRFNRAGEELLGYSRNQMLGKSDYDLFTKEEADFFIAKDREVLKSGRLMDIPEEPIQTRGKGTRILHTKKVPILDKAGQPQYLLGISEDITERKQAEEALRESRERFRGAFDSAASGMALVALDGRWLQVNRSLCEIVGYSEQEMLATNFQAITHPDDLETDLAYVRKMLAGEIRTYQMEKRYFHKLGEVVWILLSVSLIRNSQGKPLYFISQIQDITERKRAEDALRESQQRLSQLLDDRERMSQDLHDNIIQTLYAIGLSLEESQRLIGEDSKMAVKNVGHTIKDLNAVIRDVRSYITGIEPKISTGRQFITAVERLARTMEGTNRLHFTLRIEPEAAERLAPDEASHVLYIVREAMSNSLRHSQAKTGAVSLQVRKGRVSLKIKDTGVGFDPRDGKAAGQGLSNISARAKDLGAKLTIVSQPGSGTRIVLDIPMEDQHATS